ncbi:hypothetical protein PR202_ga30628 [Eleusine coracana subsp. coracana]|uniref:Late embryogenesis abundant protein LEA-2 subgroup domain-containing protein n=1 Tax=Eleusine coracana subsp. coracana TaxID=191504 RepID=A0AAV5DQE7_ELECO|nr:hypothetical protein PR202_ga30628 [Eleusine coracana subsp. coracana]
MPILSVIRSRGITTVVERACEAGDTKPLPRPRAFSPRAGQPRLACRRPRCTAQKPSPARHGTTLFHQAKIASFALISPLSSSHPSLACCCCPLASQLILPMPFSSHHAHDELDGHRQQHATQHQPYARHDRRYHQSRYGDRAHRSGAFQWCVAIVFTVLAVAVLLSAVAVLVVVLFLQPRSPYLAVTSAHLDTLAYDAQGAALDDVQLSLVLEARNGNAHAAATFSGLEARVSFARTALVRLRAADEVEVGPGAGVPLAYVARARGAPLDEEGSKAVESGVRVGVLPFEVEGEARTRWRMAGVVEVRPWTRLRCRIWFGWPNGTAMPFKCRSKSKSWFF